MFSGVDVQVEFRGGLNYGHQGNVLWAVFGEGSLPRFKEDVKFQQKQHLSEYSMGSQSTHGEDCEIFF